MKPKAISGIVYYVKDLNVTAGFYESLGFQVSARDEHQLTMRLNWFWVEFVHGVGDREERKDDKGTGQFLYLSVDDVDAYYQELAGKGLQPDGEPEDQIWSRREFIIHDPDGYKLAFFEKIK